MDSQVIDIPFRSDAEDEHAHPNEASTDAVGQPDDEADSHPGGEAKGQSSRLADLPIAPEPPLRANEAERPASAPKASKLRTTYLASSAIIVVALAGAGWMLTHGRHPAPHQMVSLPVATEVGGARAGSGGELNELVQIQTSHHVAPAASTHVVETKLTPVPNATSPVAPVPAAQVVAAVPAIHPAAPQDAADRLAHLQAAPMSPQQQVEVLDLVTKAAALIQAQRIELANVRHDQEQLHAKVDSSLDDFARRLSLREASAGLAAAQGTIAPASTVTSTGPTQAALGRVRLALASAAGGAAEHPRAPVLPEAVPVLAVPVAHHYGCRPLPRAWRCWLTTIRPPARAVRSRSRLVTRFPALAG